MAAISDYLDLLDELLPRLEELTGVQQDKLDAGRAGDLDALNRQMAREQALSLQLKGYERRQKALRDQLGLTGVPLRALPRRCPDELRERAQRTVQRLHDRYQVLRSAQETARTLMETRLRGIRQELQRRGVDLEAEEHYGPSAGPGHTDLKA